MNQRGKRRADRVIDRYWPAAHRVYPPGGLTPGQAWRAWQAGTISRTQFVTVLQAWDV